MTHPLIAPSDPFKGLGIAEMRLSKFLYFRKLSMQPFDPLRSVNQPGGESVTGENI